MLTTDQLKQIYTENVLTTYGRYPVAFASGEGAKLSTPEGREFIDFASGIGVTSIGYAHPKWVQAVSEQAAKLSHVSNLYYTEPGGKLAQKLCEITGMSGVFFSNSGAEANEGLIKIARKYSRDKYGEGRTTIATLKDSFHGRTVTTLAATGQDKFHNHFHPFTEGFVHVPAEDIAALEALGNDICALLIEPIQGEGGVIPISADYAKSAAKLCAERDWLLLVDEVQTGIGRTGEWFGFQGLGVTPDALSFAKGIGGGLPLGGFIVSEKLKTVLQPGDHATTYGGNPICCAAANAVLEVLAPELPKISEKGKYICDKITEMKIPAVAEIRYKGLMMGIKLSGVAPGEVNLKLLENGLAALTAGTDILRFLPPLTITYEEIDAGLAILEKVMK